MEKASAWRQQKTSTTTERKSYEEITDMIKSKPDWLYQATPFICLIAGVTALIYIDTPLGYIAGALLMLTASLIWMKRNTNQTPVTRAIRTAGHDDSD